MKRCCIRGQIRPTTIQKPLPASFETNKIPSKALLFHCLPSYFVLNFMPVYLYNTTWTSHLHFIFEDVKQLKTFIPWTTDPLKSHFLCIEHPHVGYCNSKKFRNLFYERCCTK